MRLPTVVIRRDILQSWLTVSDYSKSRLAEELGVSKGRISQLLSSHEEPSAHLIAKLMTLTYLPFDRLFMIVHDDLPLASGGRFSNQNNKKTTAATSTWSGRRNHNTSGRPRGSSLSVKGA